MRLHKFALLPSSHKMQKVFTTPARSTCSALNIFSRAVSSSSGSLLAVFLHTRANMLGTAVLQYLRPYLRTCFYLGEFLEWGGVGGARARKYCTPSEASVGGEPIF